MANERWTIKLREDADPQLGYYEVCIVDASPLNEWGEAAPPWGIPLVPESITTMGLLIERDDLASRLSTLEKALELIAERLDRARDLLGANHRTLGEACGDDACALCIVQCDAIDLHELALRLLNSPTQPHETEPVSTRTHERNRGHDG